jgi:hypothetical protein
MLLPAFSLVCCLVLMLSLPLETCIASSWGW